MADGLVDVADVLKSLDKQNQTIESAKQIVATTIANQQAAERDQEAQASKEGVMLANGTIMTPETQQVENLAKLKQQSQILDVATHLGTNPDDASYVLTQRADDVKDASNRMVESAKAVSDKEHTSFFDTPLKWVYDQITLPAAQSQAEADTNYFNKATTALQQAQTQTQELPKTTAAVAQTVTTASAQSQLEALQARIQSNVDALKIKNATTDMASLESLMKMGQEQVQNLISKFGVFTQQQHLQIAQATYGLHEKQVNAMLEEHQQKMDEHKLNDQEQRDFAAYAQQGAAALGFQNVANLPHTKIIQLINSKDPDVLNFLKVGMRSSLIGKPVVSDNPGETAAVLATTNAPLSAVNDKIKTLFKSAWGESTDPTLQVKNKIGDLKDMKQVSAAAGRIAFSNAQSQLGNIKDGDTTNIYAPPSLPSVASLPAVQQTTLYQSVLKDQIAAGGLQEFKPNQLISMAITGMKSGKYDYKTMSKDLTTIFGAAVLQNNALHNYTGFGLPAQTTFNTELPNSIGIPRKLNLTNPTELNSYLNSRLSAGVWGSAPADYEANPFGGGFR